MLATEWKTILNVTDLCRLVEFDKQCHIPRDVLTVDDYIGWMELDLDIQYLTNSDGKWVACYQLIEGEDGELHYVGVAVHPDYQGQGYGQIITDHMVKRAGHKKILSKTRQDNIPMQQCLKHAGFYQLPDEIVEEDGIQEHWTWWERPPTVGRI